MNQLKGSPYRWVLDEIRVSRDPEHIVRDVQIGFDRVGEYLAPFGGSSPSLAQLARLLGGCHVTGMVEAATGMDGDTLVLHGLGRVPAAIILSVDLGGLDGSVMGAPQGGLGASGSNQNPWNNESIYVRATRTAEYEFVVI